MARQGLARPGEAVEAWLGLAWPGLARRGEAVEAWLGMARPGKAVEAWLGPAWRGRAVRDFIANCKTERKTRMAKKSIAIQTLDFDYSALDTDTAGKL